MFASLKNKIREETGSDLSRLTAKLASSTAQRIDALRTVGKGSGSTSSLNSLVSSDGGQKDDACSSSEASRTPIAAIGAEKEREWKDALAERDRRIASLEREKEEAYKQIHNLKDSLQHVEDCKQKLVERQEDKEQIESFQMQELSKVKHLVLLREQELEERTAQLKDATQQLEKVRSEVNRLRRFEEQLSDVQDDLESLRHSSARDMATLASDLAQSEEERRHLADLVAILRERSTSSSNGGSVGAGSAATEGDAHFAAERRLLEQRLEEAHVHLADIKTSWSDKIAALETQVGRLSRQAAEEGSERRRAVDERDELGERVRQLECALECSALELGNKDAKTKRLAAEIEELAAELKRLRADSEEEVAFLRVQIQNTRVEMKAVKKNLENSEGELAKQAEEGAREHAALARLERELADERRHSLDVQRTLTRVTAEKNAALLRNAEVSQQVELARQAARRQDAEHADVVARVAHLEASAVAERELRTTLVSLEEQLAEKNKSIKTLQLRLADLKKTLQQELRTTNHHQQHQLQSYDESSMAAILTPTSQITTARHNHHHHHNLRPPADDDVNFTYLKHVIIKFLTSREYEAQRLTRAVATLLRLSPEEEQLLNDTLEWKMSWFGSRPKVASGGKASTSSSPPLSSSSLTSLSSTSTKRTPRS